MRADSVDAPSLYDEDESEDVSSMEQLEPHSPPGVDVSGGGRGRSASLRPSVVG